jgi:uncharacterized protein YjbI with pentapeptide repeats
MEISGITEPIEAHDADPGKSSFVAVTQRQASFEEVGVQSAQSDYVAVSEASFSRMNLSLCNDGLPPGTRLSKVTGSGARSDNVNPAGAAMRNANPAELSIRNCNIAGPRADGVLVSDALAAFRKSA